jgi:hypothetical protein
MGTDRYVVGRYRLFAADAEALGRAESDSVGAFKTIRALAHFHWDAGARVALRANAIIVAAFVFVLGSAPAPDALATLRDFLLGIVARGHAHGPRAVLAAMCLVLAASGVPRTTLGMAGWLRSLPIDGREARRATVAALTVAQLAVVVFVPLAAVLSLVALHASLSATKLLTVPLMMLAASMVVLPVRRGTARLVAAVALAASVRAGLLGFAVALVSITASDALARDVVPPRSRGTRHRRGPGVILRSPSPALMWFRASWRALGLRRLLDGMIGPVILVGFAHLMVRNNPDLSGATIDRIARVCGAIAVALAVAPLANGLLRARQPWSWGRSLPWSSTYRVAVDASVLGAPSLVIPLALLPLGGVSAAVVAALIPACALSGASALRAGVARQTGAAGESLLMALLIGIPVVIWPALAVAALALAPVALYLGARRDRAASVSRWTELQHDASGDPAWLSAG